MLGQMVMIDPTDLKKRMNEKNAVVLVKLTLLQVLLSSVRYTGQGQQTQARRKQWQPLARSFSDHY